MRSIRRHQHGYVFSCLGNYAKESGEKVSINRFGHNQDISYHKFEQGIKKTQRNFLLGFGVWWVFSALLSLGFFGVLVYIAWHFLAKWW